MVHEEYNMADGASHKSDLPESPGSRTSRAPCSIGVVVDEPVGEVRKLEQADRPALVREVVHKYPAKNERRSDVPPEEVGVRVHTVKACEERSQTDEDAQDEELVKGELEDVVVVPVGHGREAVGIGHGGQGGNADWLVVLDMACFACCAVVGSCQRKNRETSLLKPAASEEKRIWPVRTCLLLLHFADMICEQAFFVRGLGGGLRELNTTPNTPAASGKEAGMAGRVEAGTAVFVSPPPPPPPSVFREAWKMAKLRYGGTVVNGGIGADREP
ncbi:uncharacterized protein BKA78DRAFT_150218 [Phyllosticta capitalensis]|uniref:uncharacterized protein n=1 Tax=Phyllosticta capitalensis TaxID=121624 RepID=UPI00312FE891